MSKKIKRLLITGSSFLLVFIIGLSYVIYVRKTGDLLNKIEFSDSYTDRHGKLMQVFLTSDEQYRIFEPLQNFSPEFLEAILLQEDRYFYSHHGVNLISVIKAGWETYIKKSRRIGASTITMQTAKLKYKIYTHSVIGKIHQIIAAKYLELCYSKNQILEAYLNLVPVGGNIQGFATGSWYYFNKRLEELNLSEIIMLCVLPQNPTKRSPTKNRTPSELISARKVLFKEWLEKHPEDSDKEIYMDMQMDTVCAFPDRARHFSEMIKNHQSQKSRRSVQTSLDLDVQTKVENIFNRFIMQNNSLGVYNGAVLLVDWTTMEVIANIGSANFYNEEIQGQVNLTTSKRSPGSTLKPFIYAMALEEGLIHYSTVLKDTPQTFNEYTPDNYGSVFKGPVKAWFALADSRNIPAITLNQQLTRRNLYDYMKSAGVSGMESRQHYGLSIVLGTCDVTMNELISMYCTLANGGMEHKLNFLSPSRVDKGIRRFTPEASWVVLRMLGANTPPYDHKPKDISDIPVAYKTGTSIGFKDSWSVGIFDRYAICTWIGNFDGTGNNAFLGRRMAAPLLFNIAYSILSDIPYKDLLDKTKYPDHFIPPKVAYVDVCSVSGAIPNEDCPMTEKAWFIPGVSPITSCKIHRKINIDTRTGYRTDEVDKPYVKTVVREFWPSDLQQIFKQAGFPRILPPDYPPDDFVFDRSKNGYAPHIQSPMTGADYVFRTKDTSRNKIMLYATGDADAKEFMWFRGDNFIARTAPGEQYEWHPEPGRYVLTVTDQKGRGDSVVVSILQTEED